MDLVNGDGWSHLKDQVARSAMHWIDMRYLHPSIPLQNSGFRYWKVIFFVNMYHGDRRLMRSLKVKFTRLLGISLPYACKFALYHFSLNEDQRRTVPSLSRGPL